MVTQQVGSRVRIPTQVCVGTQLWSLLYFSPPHSWPGTVSHVHIPCPCAWDMALTLWRSLLRHANLQHKALSKRWSYIYKLSGTPFKRQSQIPTCLKAGRTLFLGTVVKGQLAPDLLALVYRQFSIDPLYFNTLGWVVSIPQASAPEVEETHALAQYCLTSLLTLVILATLHVVL